MKSLLAKYKNKIADAPLGKKYQECFDIKRGKPSDSYVEIYDKVKKELEDLGVKFQH